MTFNWDVNLGSVLTGLAIIVGVWQAHEATRRESMKMHTENQNEIRGLREQVKLISEWMQSQWHRSNGD